MELQISMSRIDPSNKNMGGVDTHDWLAGLYSLKIRGEKMYWPFSIHSLDQALVNAWIIHKLLNKDEVLNKEFRRAATTTYLKKTVIRAKGRPEILTVI
ncbi:uncharacterized protein TNCV_3499931 [Trichonephila clavipes]|nr:uncharacterized protein TNCV_3499931 [Trichonephila clavipes]